MRITAQNNPCTSSVHQDMPNALFPKSYLAAHYRADLMLSSGWGTLVCPDCGFGYWVKVTL